MELPFAVESPERTSQILEAPTANSNNHIADDDDDDGSSLVTTSSQGSFLGSSSGGMTTSGVGFSSTNSSSINVNVNHAHPTTTATTTMSTTLTDSMNPNHHSSSSSNNHHTNNMHANSNNNTMRPLQPEVATAGIMPHHHHHQQQQQQHPSHPTPPTRPTIQAPTVPTVPVSSNRSRGSSLTSGLASGLNIFGSVRVPSVFKSSKPKPYPSNTSSASTQQHQSQQQQQQPRKTETIDFTYEYVCETDADEVDITLDGQHSAMQGLHGRLGGGGGGGNIVGRDGAGGDGGMEDCENYPPRGDILSILLSGAAQQENNSNNDNETLVRKCEEANQAANRALEAKRDGELQAALDAHAQAAKQFREAAVLIKDRNASMANSLLLLSQTQAKSALALKRIVRQQPTPHNSKNPADPKHPRVKMLTQKDRLRAAVRGALLTRNEKEMSDSIFLGKATKGPLVDSSGKPNSVSPSSATANKHTPTSAPNSGASHNPVDDMMELERELRDMDMALEMGNSIASLDARTQSRLKNSIGVDGSFMVVPGSQSYMSSSNMWAPSSGSSSRGNTSSNSNNNNNNNKQNQGRAAAVAGTAGVRARANRVQNKLGASSHNPLSPPHHHLGAQQQQQGITKNPTTAAPAQGLDASWWGNASGTSQMLASSVISLGASSIVRGGAGGAADANSTASTKQIMRLMDALKTLGDENANLLREVEEAEAARMEAKAAKEQMAKFKSEYGTRFAHLKAALQKFRESHPENGPGATTGGGDDPNPVVHSEFMRSASTSEQLQRQEQLIRKLTADLKKEKEESKKKDQALRKYESFYREVKARSAQKAAQRQREAGASSQRPPQAQGRKSGQR